MASLIQFSRNIRKRGSQIENASPRIVKAAAKRALRALVKATPVDTGRARSNWRVGIGAPTRAEIEPYAPGRHLGINETSNASAAIAAGEARINGISNKGPLTESIYVSNNTRYIQRLNNGYSTQAPAGFIETALIEARAEIRAFRVFHGD